MNISPLSWTVASWNYWMMLGIRVFPILELKSPIMNIFPSFENLSIASWHSPKNIFLPSLDLFIFGAYIFMKWIFSVFILIVIRIIFFFTYSTSSIIFSNFWCISILTSYGSVLFLYSTVKKSVIFIWRFFFACFSFLKMHRHLCCAYSFSWWFLDLYYSMILHSSILGIVWFLKSLIPYSCHVTTFEFCP